MSPKPDVSEQRKTQIIEAAMKVFSREGFHKARMDDIAKEADLSKGALYWYFKSKDKIISAILYGIFERELTQFNEYSVQGGSARESLERIGEMLVDDLIRMRPFMSILYEFWAMSMRNKVIGDVIKDLLWRYVDVFVPIFQRGVDNGEFRQLDPRDVAMAFGSLIEGSILVWSYDMDNVDFKTLIGKSITIFLDGISIRG